MLKKKWGFWTFRAYEGEAMAEYLEKMAAEGWMFKNLWSSGIFCFEKCEPAQMEFAAVILPGSSEFSSRRSGSVMEFGRRCQEAGWTVRHRGVIWQIFSREKRDGAAAGGAGVQTEASDQAETRQMAAAEPDAVAVNSSQDAEGGPLPLTPEQILDAGKAVALSPVKWINVVLLFGLVGVMLWMIGREPGIMLADSEVLIALLCLFLVWLIHPYELGTSIAWYRKAKRCLAQTGRLPSVKLCQVRRRRQGEQIYLSGCCLLLLAEISAAWRIYGVFQAIILVIVCSGVMAWVHENGSDDQGANLITYFVGAVILGVLANMLLTGVWTRIGFGENDRYRRLAEFPVNMEAYGYESSREWRCKSTRSWFGAYQRETFVKQEVDNPAKQRNPDRLAVTLKYYTNRIPAVIQKTADQCLMDYGDFWVMTQTESCETEGITMTGYDCHVRTDDGREGDVPHLALYIFEDENRLLVLDFYERPEREWIDALAKEFAGGKHLND